jgi:hypothetical protein
MSNNKCAYCEAKLSERQVSESIDHYQCQARHPDKVKLWTNLLPACMKCNGSQGKGRHTLEKRCPLEKDSTAVCNVMHIINPTITDPRQELYYCDCFFYAKTDLKGKATIYELDLNNLYKQKKFGECKTYSEIHDKVDGEIEGSIMGVDLLNRVHVPCVIDYFKVDLEKRVDNLYEWTSPQHEFSAVHASEIFQHKNYATMLNLLKLPHVLSTINLLAKVNALEQQVEKVAFDHPAHFRNCATT